MTAIAAPENRARSKDAPNYISQYRVLEVLHEGTSSTVYRGCAIDDPNVQVAIKVARAPWNQADLETRVRFEREAEFLSRLDNPHIVKLIRHGVYEGRLFLVTELARGKTLAQIISERSPLGPQRCALILKQAALALAHAHSKHLLHRDIKPANIVVADVDSAPHVKVLDFGLSRFQGPAGSDNVGTFLYMSPEQLGILPQPADERSDLYSLGISAVELLANKHPFGGKQLRDLIHSHAAVVPTLPATVPEGLRQVVLCLCKKEPGERYRTASGLAADLEIFLERFSRGDPSPFPLRTHDRSSELTTPTFLGREAPRVALAASYDAAKTVGLQVAVVAGASGIGKTRLLAEASRGWSNSVTLWGRGRAYGQASAFGLLAEALKGLVSQPLGDEAKRKITAAVGELGAELLRLVPELASLISATSELVPLEPERRQQRFLALVTDLISAIGSPEAPLVLILDDVQWADEGSLQVVHHLTRNASSVPMLLVLAYRSEELTAGGRIARMLDSIVEGGKVARVMLEPLSTNDVRALVASMLGTDFQRLGDAVAAQAAGSPLHAVELTFALAEAGVVRRGPAGWELAGEQYLNDALFSESLIQTIVGRLERLSEDQREVLTLAAVVGRNFEFDVLRRTLARKTAQTDEQAARSVVLSLKAAEDARLIVENQQGSYSFRHDKIREAIYDKLSPETARQIHGAVGVALETAVVKTDQTYALAYHFGLSSNRDKALRYVLAAGALANEHHAHLEAVRFFEQANHLVEQLSDASAREDALRHIGEGLADGCNMTGQYDRALTAYDGALKLAAHAEDTIRLKGKIGGVLFAKGEAARAGRALEEALAALGEWTPRSMWAVAWRLARELLVQAGHTLVARKRPVSRDPRRREIGKIYSRLSYVYYFTDSLRALATHLRHMNVLERDNVIDELGHAYSNHGPVCSMVPWFSRGIRYARRSLALHVELGDRWGAAQSRHFLTLTLGSAGQWREAIEEGRIAEEELEHVGDRWELVTLVVNIGYNHAYLGEWDAAEAYADKTHRLATELSHSAGLAYAVWLRAEIGSRLNQHELLRAVESNLSACLDAGDIFSSCQMLVARGKTLVRLNQFAAAEAAFRHGIELMHKNLLHSDYLLGMYPGLVEAIVCQAEQASAPNERSMHVRRAKGRLRIASVLVKGFPNHRVAVLRMKARLAWLSGSHRKAERLWAEAQGIAVQMGQVYQQALCLMDWGLALHQRAERRAVHLLAAALPLLQQLRARHDIERLLSAVPELERASSSGGALSVSSSNEGSSSTGLRMLQQERLGSLVEVSRNLSATLVVDDLLKNIINSASQVLGAERGVLYLLDAKGGLQARAAFGSDTGGPEEMPETILGAVTDSGRGIHLSDAQADARFKGAQSVVRSGVRSVLCVPLSFKNRLLGVIYLDSRLMRGLFQEEDLLILEALASQAAVALENARAFDELVHALERAEESSRLKSEFLASTSHELRTPLNSIINIPQAMLESFQPQDVATCAACQGRFALEPDEKIVGDSPCPECGATQLRVQRVVELALDGAEASRLLKSVVKSGEQLLAVVNDILDYSKLEAGKEALTLSKVDVDELIDHVYLTLEPAAKRTSVTLIKTPAPSGTAVNADSVKLIQVLTNLVANAIKFSDSKGRVWLEAQRTPTHVRFLVRDEGIGIAPEHQALIFEGFRQAHTGHTRKYGGTGLGLAISKRLVELHGGEMKLESEVGRGSTFWFELPSSHKR